MDASGRMKKNCWYNGQYFNNKGQLEKNATKYDPETTEGQVTKEMLDELPLSNCTKLMVVAHPDDETLWGGAHLTEGGWFVVCLTNGYNEVRKNEFEVDRAMNFHRLFLLKPKNAGHFCPACVDTYFIVMPLCSGASRCRGASAGSSPPTCSMSSFSS